MNYDCYNDDPDKCSFGYYGTEEDFEKTGEFLTIDEISHLMDIRLHVKYDQKDRELEFDKKTGLYYTTTLFANSGETLINHILVEKCMQNRDKIDWQRTTKNYDFDMVGFIRNNYEHPLIWDTPNEAADEIFLGLIVKEGYREYYPQDINEFWAKLYNDGLLWFADNLPTIQDAPAPFRYYQMPDDFIVWDRLFSTEAALYHRYDCYKQRMIIHELFNVQTFRHNINYIAQERGGAKAAQIVRLLRDDWQDIMLFKYFNIDNIPQQQAEEFRLCLFEGMDRNLRNWESQAEKTEKETPACPYIDHDKLAQTGIYTSDEFKNMLRQACEQDAPTLGAFLKKYVKAGYLDFHGANKKKIYETLKACFPGTMNYSYVNFTQYFI